MSLVKNVSGGPLDVPVLGRVVEDGESVEVPDYQPDGTSPLVWPPDKWQPDGPRAPSFEVAKEEASADEKGM